ncbi:hypothetical protein C8R45DRAFT_1114217 [Mycena sanguinolenta]|nr:hypothetical protein C8R45DRAFT_948207 [Mycena sanguinolenta]KAJ6450302.1 hypothetical protein C8R45DRAFT_1114217 [Mycena sanguinolenta]
MANSSSSVPTAANSEKDLAAVVTALMQLTVDATIHALDLNDKALTKLIVDMTRLCLDVQDKLPRVVRAEVEAAVAEVRPPTPIFYQGVAPTPAQMEGMFPAGRGDNQQWHVVCVGRQPGLYATSDEADVQVHGVPDQSRRRMTGRAAALAYYRQMYEQGKVMRLTEIAA